MRERSPGDIIRHIAGVNPKAREGDEEGEKFLKPKSNSSMSAALVNRVLTREKRSVWSLSTQPFAGKHFATFPPKLVEPCVKAGTSEYGVCAVCGAPYYRVGKPRMTRRKNGATKFDNKREQKAANLANFKTAHVSSDGKWTKHCMCPPADPVPAIVFDPFMGAGTTGLVAYNLGRDFYGTELSAKYIGIAQKRISDQHPLAASMGLIFNRSAE